MKTIPTCVAIAVTAALAACGQSHAPEAAAPAAQEQAAPTPPPAPAPPVASAGPAVADIAAWERGLAAEKKAVQDAGARLAEAKGDEQATLAALRDVLDTSTLDVGAAAAGLDREAYRRLRSTLSMAVGQLSPIEMEMDVSAMPAPVLEQMKQARELAALQITGTLPADLVAALKPRAAELRQQDKALLAERLKVAQAAR